MNPTVAIIGANGFLGRYLTRHFTRTGREVAAIARSRKGWSGDGMFLQWNGKDLGPWALALEGAEVVINLAGRSVNCRYNALNRKEILRSRTESTTVVGEAIANCKVPPKLWINASTATYYRHAEDCAQDEWQGERGTGFSVEVAEAWEDAFFRAKVPGATRKIAARTSMVLANEQETVFDVFNHLARRGLGGTLGNGNQRISWIHMEDFLRSIEHLMKDPFIEGIVNISAPEAPSNRQWMKYFREMAGMPLGLPASRQMLEIGARLLKTETELVLKSRWVNPLRLKESGFRWRYPTATGAIDDLELRDGLDGFFRQPKPRSLGSRAWLPALD